MIRRYVLPRNEKRRRGPVTMLANSNGGGALIAAVIGVALNDYLAGNDRAAEDARWYFAGDFGDYDRHLQMLGLPPDYLPEAIRDRVIEVEL